jgi:hypothetical protein
MRGVVAGMNVLLGEARESKGDCERKRGSEG